MKTLKIDRKAFMFFMTLLITITSCTTGIGDGKSKISLSKDELTTIAVSTTASDREKFAAEELASYLNKITGKELSVITVDSSMVPDGTIAIGELSVSSGMISREELGPIGEDGFVINIADNKGAICGWRDLGTVYGVYELLKQVGVKFYAEDCEIIPSKSKLKIPELRLAIKPHYDLRTIFKYDVYFKGITPSMKLGYTPNDDMGYHGDLGAPGERNWVHSASFMMPYRIFGKEHPEYFALNKSGERVKPGEGPPGHLCLSNEEMRKAGAERLLHLIEKQEERTFFVVTQGDGRSSHWCQCSKCKALDAIPGDHMTDRLMDYVNYNARVVNEKYPGKKILTLAYTEATSRPPERVMPDPNVMVMYCPYPPQTMCQSHGLDCPKNSTGFEELQGWIEKCPDNMYIFDYPRGYRVWYEPFGSFYAMVDKMNFYATHGIRGIIQCVVPTSFTDLFVFVQGQLFWNPDADVEKLIDEFMDAYYGEAAPHMREYFNFMHNEIKTRPVHQHCERPNPELVTAEYAAKALEMFHKAQEAVADDSISLQHVEIEKFCLLFSDVNQRNTRNDQLAISMPEHAKRLAETVRIAKDMEVIRVGNLPNMINFKDWLRSISLLSLQAEPWYYDPGVDAFLNNPENIFIY
jgi:hypothetical protein